MYNGQNGLFVTILHSVTIDGVNAPDNFSPGHRSQPTITDKYMCEKLMPCPGAPHQSCGCNKVFDADNEAAVYWLGASKKLCFCLKHNTYQ